jgi:hypothetical protein
MYFELLLQDAILATLERVEMSFVAEILTFDKATMRATIRPRLFAEIKDAQSGKAEKQDIPDIQDVPVEMIFAGGYYIRPVYATGDLVHVSCYASATKPAIDGNTRSNAKLLRFQLSNCTVTGGLVPKGTSAPAGWSEPGLVIGKGGKYIALTDTGAKIVGSINVQGDVTITGNLSVDGDVSVTGDVSAANVSATGDVKAGPISLKTHVHISGTAGSPTSPPQ